MFSHCDFRVKHSKECAFKLYSSVGKIYFDLCHYALYLFTTFIGEECVLSNAMCVVKCFVSDVHVHKDGLYTHTDTVILKDFLLSFS